MNHRIWNEQFKSALLSWNSNDNPENLDAIDLNNSPLTPTGVEVLALAASCLESSEVYCEITSYPNFRLANVLANQSDLMAYSVIENLHGMISSLDQFVEYLLETELSERVLLCNQTSDCFFQDLADLSSDDKIGLFFYDAIHDYHNQFIVLKQVIPFLSQQALIVINQNHWQSAKQSSLDFAEIYPQFQLCFDGTVESDLPKWNGLQVFTWDGNHIDINQASCLPETKLERRMEIFQQEQLLVAQTWLQKMENLIQVDHIESASQICQLLLRWQPKNEGLWLQQTWLLFQLVSVRAALKSAEGTHRLAMSNKNSVILQELAYLLKDNAQLPLAICVFQDLIRLEPDNDKLYCELGFLYLSTYCYDDAARFYDQALKINITEEASYRYLDCLIETGQIQQALEFGEKSIIRFPKSVRLKIRVYLALPVLYINYNEILQHRSRFESGLNRLIQETIFETDEQLKKAVFGIGFSTNFYLGYQGKNDLLLQQKYGNFIQKIMSRRFPEWQKCHSISEVVLGRKIRIGYFSRFLFGHTISKLFYHWIADHDQDKIEIFTYYAHTMENSFVDSFRAASNHFCVLPPNIEEAAQQIIKDDLHVLVYLDTGLAPSTTLLASLRLAPIQCVAWGHPITSGLPSIDYFLSSHLMEPTNAQDHYSEELVLLPNLSIIYPQPEIHPLKSSRTEILPKLSDADIIYISCQSLYKYLPQYDFVYPKIAQQVPQAKFLFLSHVSPQPTEIFKKRLQSAFESVGLYSEDFCLILPRQTRDGYLALNQISDIYLDTFAWSGGNTTFEAVACGLPIVTCPGEFMRGRHTYGILKRLGVTETIAEDEQGYIDIAVRLGLDPVWRQQIAQAVRQNQHKVFHDPTCLPALEAFYEQVVRK